MRSALAKFVTSAIAATALLPRAGSAQTASPATPAGTTNAVQPAVPLKTKPSAAERGRLQQARNQRLPNPQFGSGAPGTPGTNPQGSVPQTSNPQNTGTSQTPDVPAPLIGPKPAPAPTPPPGRLDLQPAVLPRMSFVAGQLTIVANNSSLSDILNGFQRITGAKVENSVGISPDRVFGQFGPGTPRDVLASVMNGTNYNYVILSKEQDQGNVQQVIISQKSGGAGGPGMAGSGMRQPTPVQQPSENSQEDGAPEQEDNQQPAPAPQPMPPITMPNNNGQPRTPQELLQEMQQRNLRRNTRPNPIPIPPQ